MGGASSASLFPSPRYGSSLVSADAAGRAMGANMQSKKYRQSAPNSSNPRLTSVGCPSAVATCALKSLDVNESSSSSRSSPRYPANEAWGGDEVERCPPRIELVPAEWFEVAAETEETSRRSEGVIARGGVGLKRGVDDLGGGVGAPDFQGGGVRRAGVHDCARASSAWGRGGRGRCGRARGPRAAKAWAKDLSGRSRRRQRRRP